VSLQGCTAKEALVDLDQFGSVTFTEMNGEDYEGKASELPSVDDFGSSGGDASVGANCGAGRWPG
jgi:hypothetical protein